MKIAHIVCTFPPYKGGMGNSAFHFAKALFDIGHDVTVFFPEHKKYSDNFLNVNFKIEKIKPMIRFGNASFLPSLFFKLKEYDLVHLHYPFYGTAEVVLLRKLLFQKKIKLIIHYHMEPTAKGVKGLLFKLNRLFIEPLLVRSSDLITCASLDYVAHSSLGKYFKNNKNKFRETYFGINPKTFKQLDNKRNINDEKIKNILFVGGLDKAHYFKGINILLKALSRLDNYRLQIVGDGDMRQDYEERAKALGVAERVNFAGKVSDEKLPEFYQNCDIFVLPSINKGEAFGIVLIEAMACGKPVVASNLPGVRSVFKDGNQGLFAKPGDAEDLADKIKTILSNNDLAKKMGESGKRLVEEKYTWEKVGEKLDSIYKEILK